jgi:hypothetical protein
MRRFVPLAVTAVLFCAGLAYPQDSLDVDQIIRNAVRQDSITRAEVGTWEMDAVSYVRKLGGDGEVKEEKKFLKTYYFRDSLFKAVFHEYYRDGELQSQKELDKEIKEAAERRRKGRNRDASVNPMEPFYPENRGKYIFTLAGKELTHGCIAYHIIADCLEENEDLLEGDFWFEINHLNLLHAEFRPAKLPSKIKMLEMTKDYAPVEAGYWLPVGFRLRGKGQVLLFIKFNFAVEERYSKWEVNLDLPDTLFEENSDGDENL